MNEKTKRHILATIVVDGQVDAVAPTVTIALSSYTAATDTAAMTITFSEVVTGFAVGDITITAGGSLASFATSDNKTFTVSWTLAAGANTMDIAAGVCVDAAGNENTAASQFGIGAEQTQTLQPNETDGIDTYIQSNAATTNYGTNAKLYVGEYPGFTFTDRALLKFTGISQIPSNALIKTATLKLKVLEDPAGNTTGVMKAHCLLRNWVEAEATWNIYSTGNNWGTAGGFNASDCEQTDIGSVTLDPAVVAPNDVVSLALTPSRVQEWVHGTVTYYGVLLKMETETDNSFAFHSSSAAVAGNRPIHEVVYRVPL